MHADDNPTGKSGSGPAPGCISGGGARLCLLMAVCSVLEADRRIQVTRMAGSSAGAIAAAMLASEKKIETYIADLKRIAPKISRSTSDIKISWRSSRRPRRRLFQKFFSGEVLS